MESDRLIADLVAGFFVALGIFGLLVRWGLMSLWAKRVEKTSDSRPESSQVVGPEEEKMLSVGGYSGNPYSWLSGLVGSEGFEGEGKSGGESGGGTK